jgi:Zn-dependent protease
VFHYGYMFPSYRLGSLFGFPIRANLSFLLLLGVIPLMTGSLAGVTIALVAFGSVVLHELGHALMARRLGVRVASIDLHFFGGAARMADSSRSPGDEIKIAAAGPAVSFALAGLGYAAATVTGWSDLVMFAGVNLVIGLFNLLPVFPSDGGRILRALLARRRGLLPATDLAIKVARVLCVVLAIFGLTQGMYQLVLIAGVLWMMGSAERLALRLRGGGPDWQSPSAAARQPEVVYLPPEQARAERGRPPVGRPPRHVVFWRY